ncbi:M3 family oligoendopeptidase [Heyndrickxia acidicola]|uniref:M3 family oligoendopeptidase n=1 Tax=Heyndrickxia acidicola TaxID=209389 RepID=A0ABU6MK41_9BACI|nr:M3 family oligoendopeptidase [Heyndrickxia acidicola]MED1205054.1 M3 family oligoendopeptidase [Heyndrickxia acidicola]
MNTAAYSETWDLDVFFSGGSHSSEFHEYLKQLSHSLATFKQEVDEWKPASKIEDVQELAELLAEIRENSQHLRQAVAFVGCLQAQDVLDSHANELRGRVSVLSAEFNTTLSHFDEKLSNIEVDLWSDIMEKEPFNAIQFVLNERRQKAKEKLSKEQEALINALSVDGYHGWGEMYDALVSHVKIPFSDNDEEKELSVGQASNKFSHPNRKVRQEVFKSWENAWDQQADLLAATLNHLSGFRLAVYKERKWDTDILKEALSYNRMEKETLDTMWKVISDLKEPFKAFLERKAKLLGVENLSWFDLDAPVGDADHRYSFQEGAAFIIHHFREFGDKLADFTEIAFEDRWIEAADRPGKRPGGFCTSFPVSGQSRIFMTYSGTPSNVSTLAHELGHAFHSYALKDVHALNRSYAMNVAETASTFAEMIVADASLKSAKGKAERIHLLEDKIQRSVALLMNIHARFLFETRFYEERKKGVVSKERLNSLMLEAQKEAYGDSLEEYHPLFWASKLHFFITGTPFYNFPYTFGYLFSLGIYAKAMNEGKGFENQYMALLRDTGSMKVEELALKHLNADLTQRKFWEDGIKLCIEDVEEFLELTK